MKIEVSNAEIADKVSILEIKLRNAFEDVRQNLNNELDMILPIFKDLNIPDDLYEALTSVNESIWVVEDKIRKKELKKEFDNEFIQLARAVYILNDERALLKKQINIISKSFIIEEKLYGK